MLIISMRALYPLQVWKQVNSILYYITTNYSQQYLITIFTINSVSPSSKYISLSSAKVNITLRINQVSTALLSEHSKEAVTYFPFTFCLPAVLNQMEHIKTITKGRQQFPSDCLPQPGSSVKVTKVICINSLPCHLISCPCWVSGNKPCVSVLHTVTIRTNPNSTQLSKITLDSY